MSDEMSSRSSTSPNEDLPMEGHTAHHVVSDDFEDIDLEECVPDEAELPDVDSDLAKTRLARLVAMIERMEPTRPEIMRAVPLHRVLACVGKVFWTAEGDFFQLSKETTSYDEFLSHSWQVESWKKVLLLMILKNGFPASVIGTSGALLMVVLWQFGFLPGFVKLEFQFSFWCSVVGMTLGLSTLIFWRSHRLVFVDRMCINQFDGRMKAEGIMNIGAMLKASKSLLVVWDESYADRLWCIFELAAFLKAHPEVSSGKSRILQVKPLMLGFTVCNLCVCVFLAGTFGVLNPAEDLMVIWSLLLLFMLFEGLSLSHTVRGYYRSLEASNRKLQQFELRHSFCWCCSVNHLNPASGQPIQVCDREIVRQCVTSWFGSEQEFDHSVRSVVAHALKQQLGCDAFPYTWMLGSTTPLLWPLFDFVASYQGAEKMRYLAPSWAIRILAYWLWGIPFPATVGLFAARCLREKGQSRFRDFLKTLLVIIIAAPCGLVVIGWQIYIELNFFDELQSGHETWASLLFVGGCAVMFWAARKAYHLSNQRFFKSLTLATS
ncbi:unnamed protein product [Durusdinium trenchii]|uniref:TIR domain-containing protein n=3 Tax=Durusdinium trenchii TaxID=1381693 RepID=A0ABP0KRW6_9DINO